MAPAARHVPDAANPAPDSDRPGYPIPGSPAGAENGKPASVAREPREEKLPRIPDEKTAHGAGESPDTPYFFTTPGMSA